MVKAKKLCLIVLRLLALPATISATIVTVTSHESIKVYNLSFSAKYNDTPSLKYFVIANLIRSFYSLLVLFVPPESLLGRVAMGLDVVVTPLLTSGISAALAIAYVGKKGNSNAGWLPICERFFEFCDHVAGALMSGFIAAIIYLVLVPHSIHSLQSSF